MASTEAFAGCADFASFVQPDCWRWLLPSVACKWGFYERRLDLCIQYNLWLNFNYPRNNFDLERCGQNIAWDKKKPDRTCTYIYIISIFANIYMFPAYFDYLSPRSMRTSKKSLWKLHSLLRLSLKSCKYFFTTIKILVCSYVISHVSFTYISIVCNL